MTLIVDASIAAKWFFEEEGSARALQLREEPDLTAPDFILLEVHHAMWKRMARLETEKVAVQRVQSALRIAISRLAPSEALAEAAGVTSATVYAAAMGDGHDPESKKRGAWLKDFLATSKLRIAGPCGVTFDRVKVRYHPKVVLEVHIDTDEGNACDLESATFMELTK